MKLWWLLWSFGGCYEVVVVAMEVVVVAVQLWWLLGSFGGCYGVVVVAMELWWLLRSFGGCCHEEGMIIIPTTTSTP